MHLIATIPGGWNPNEEGVFYIDQKPGDILFLSASDTELNTVKEAYSNLHSTEPKIPSLRTTNLVYMKQELTIDTYLDEVASQAKLIVLRLLGGKAYYSYLCEAILEIAEDNDIPIIFLPGYDQPDLELMQMSTAPFGVVDKLWKYLVAGGVQNTKTAIQLLLNQNFSKRYELAPIEHIPHLFFYNATDGILNGVEPQDKPVALIFTYRAHYLASNLKPIDAICASLEAKGMYPVVLMALSFRDAGSEQEVEELIGQLLQAPSVIINTTGFALKTLGDNETGIFDRINAPVIQAIFASSNKEVWQANTFGLPPTNIAMNVALPEVDGKIIASVISFKESQGKDELTDAEVIEYVPHQEGIDFVTQFAANWCSLQQKHNEDKRVALIMPNYPNKDSRLANGVGLDTPASTVKIIAALKGQGYDLGSDIPEDSEALIAQITSYVTNDLDSLVLKDAAISIGAADFFKYYNAISEELRSKIEEQWGHPLNSPMHRNGQFMVPGFTLGNVFVSIQPSRGYNVDVQASYHSPDLPPTYEYLAFYFWLQYEFNADALIHVGKHGNLEWLPGKSVALSRESCFPAAVLGPIPHFYPFIINDPGEGTQAKRRNQAVILDHLVPPLTRAESYGDLIQLEQLIDEYYEAALVDAKRSALLKKKISELVESTQLKSDLGTDTNDIELLLEAIDGYLCELKEAQIRGGLHIFGNLPVSEKLPDLIVALHRLPYAGVQGITQALAQDYELGFDPLAVDYETPFEGEIEGATYRTKGKVIELLEQKAKHYVEHLLDSNENVATEGTAIHQVLQYIQSHTLAKLQGTENEIGNLIHGLNGRYVPSGGSGAPTRGRLDILPTGRNFYSVDVRTVPTQAAYELGKKSADLIIQRYLQENGEYPHTVGLSVWGTSTMRTGGDDIAQALALLGVEPIWEGKNRRVKDFKVIPLMQLKRPRVDVMLRISGFFRDAFPDIISLFNAAVKRVAEQDEPLDQNPVRRRVLEEKEKHLEKGLDPLMAEERSLYRVFGSKPGAYGAGLQGVIDGQNWTTAEDLAKVYINWSGYAYYGKQNSGRSAHEVFKQRLSTIDVVMQNQDNREHDILDSDDYYQFQGGMAVAVKTEKGESSEVYFGDHSRPENPRVKTLKQELHKVYRSRVVNPKWIKGMQDHGYKGAFEMAATMDYLFAYDATTDMVEDFMYEGITEAYLMDETNKAFLEKHNPWALKDMSERMLEAIQRKMWKNPDNELIEALKSLYLEAEGELE